MEVKPGYKQTEVGVIPEDWEVKPLSDVSSEISDGIHTTPSYVKSSDFYFVNGNNLVNDRIIITDVTLCVSESEYRKLRKRLTERTLLLSINGTIGNLAFYQGEQVVLGKSAAYINLDKSVSKHFVAYCLKNRPTSLYFDNELTGTTISNLSLQSLRNTPLPFPPTIDEQCAIAAALRDVDGLLSGLDRLIAKKGDLRQAAMLQLLTPKASWEIAELEAIADVIDPHPSHRAPDAVANGIPFVGIGDLDENGEIVGTKIRRVAPSIHMEHLSRYDLEEELIGLGRVASIGKVVRLKPVSEKYAISPTLGIIRATKVSRGFLLYSLRSNFVTEQFRRIMSGSTRSSVGMVVLRRLKIAKPPTELEQNAIADALSDMDAELAALERRREKTRALKQAMMQELLTGKTRLVAAGGSHARTTSP